MKNFRLLSLNDQGFQMWEYMVGDELYTYVTQPYTNPVNSGNQQIVAMSQLFKQNNETKTDKEIACINKYMPLAISNPMKDMLKFYSISLLA